MAYRILAPCAGLGFGFPAFSFREALKNRFDLIAADAGSIDPGPYYLGKGISFMEKPQTKRDFSLMLEAALQQSCPLIIGSCGLAGDTPHLEFMLDIAREIFEEKALMDVRVAVISGHVDNDLLIGCVDDLKPLGHMPPLTEDMIRTSAIVGQMGIAPLIKALEEGAQLILAGRSCDVAIFAADPIRRGIDPGLAFHAAHILECGAAAAEPSSGMDCLIGEFRDDGSVLFIAPNPNRRTTIQSIAAHSLFEESHPLLQFYPEGVLTLLETEYFQHDARTAGLRKSVFVHRPLTVKLEGSERVGGRVVSLLFCKSLNPIPPEYMVYGRNGVEETPVSEKDSEIGVLIKVSSGEPGVVEPVGTALKGHFLHFDYEGCISTAGNMAFPLSPSEINFQDEHGRYICAIIGGTRDPFFQRRLEEIKAEAYTSVRSKLAGYADRCSIEILTADRKTPLLFLETIGKNRKDAWERHQMELERLEAFVDETQPSLRSIYAGDAFKWSIYHLLKDEALIRDRLFPVTVFKVDGRNWQRLKEIQGDYRAIGLEHYKGILEEEKLAPVEVVAHPGRPVDFRPLIEMASVIRSKNAGVNSITYEIYFHSEDEYRQALDSGLFEKRRIASILQIPLERIVGSFRAEACHAIKITAHRAILSGTPGDRDVFGAQQHMKLVSMRVPIF
ncbi:MAG: DUF4387 family protein [Deltaproteobacteria bacterium]|nr:MAG: DUF4387 family protein [Deltaproteobacteria bacterium]